MFEPLFLKENEKEVLRAVFFEPYKHELRFYQFMFDIEPHKNWRWVLDWYTLKSWDEELELKEWDVILIDEFDHRKPKIVSKEEILDKYIRDERKQLTSFSSFDCSTWIIIQDDEWEMHVVTSRSTWWNVYETYFIEQYQKLQEERAESWDYSWFYDELEKRTFTDIEDKPFIDLTTC